MCIRDRAYRDSITVDYSDDCYSEGTNIYQSAKVTALDLSAAMGKLSSTAAEILKNTLETAEDPAVLLNEDGTIPVSYTHLSRSRLSKNHVIARQCAHCRGNPPEFSNILDPKPVAFTSIRGIPTPVCGLVRNDNVYWRLF